MREAIVASIIPSAMAITQYMTRLVAVITDWPRVICPPYVCAATLAGIIRVRRKAWSAVGWGGTMFVEVMLNGA